MILQSLHALYGRLKDDPNYRIAPPGYSLQKITFRVVVTPEGKLFEIQDVRVKSGRKSIPIQLIVPGKDKPTGEVTNKSVHNKVKILRNDLPFVVGAKIEEREEAQTGVKIKTATPTHLEFEAFRRFHLSIEKEIDDKAFAAVCRFLSTWDPKDTIDHQEWVELGSGQGVFQLQGESGYIHDRPAVRAWWDNRRVSYEDDEECVSQCLITGETQPIARLHEPKIKRVALSSGAPIVSFDKNSDAFCSYGKDKQQGYNAPVSRIAAFRYATALNALLDGPMSSKHTFTLGDSTVVFWTEKPTTTEDIFARFAWGGSTTLGSAEVQDEALREKLEVFLRALRKGREAYGDLEDDPDGTPFFMLGMTGQAKGRVGIRFFHRNKLADLLDNLRGHYADTAIQRQYVDGSKKPDPEFPSAQNLLDETCPLKKGKPDREKIPPILAGPLLRAIITGERYPDGLYSAVIRRIHADRTINYPRACVIKGYLTRNLNQEVSMSLNTERKDPAYRLGRLFAALEKTQLDALGKVNASIRDRFYSSASATPRSVFPRLLRTYQHHLAKLEGGHKVNREKLVQEVVDLLDDFPAHLNLAEQGIFAIGYYHQTRDFYTKKED
jgi:CRISPR-associated protein Csd1